MKRFIGSLMWVSFVALSVTLSCAEEDSVASDDAWTAGDSPLEDSPSETSSQSSVACQIMTEACDTDQASPCGMLFGRPSALTGLPSETCSAQCSCGDMPWTPPPIEASYTEFLRSLSLVDEIPLLAEDPYQDPLNAELLAPTLDTVCAVRLDGLGGYTLEDYASAAEALADSARITHYGACGACSSLQDLAVYINYPDLTEPVRECGIVGIIQGDDAQMTCIEALGFSGACAQIWSFNTSNTRSNCQEICMALIDAPYHQEDGSPNDCIQCDEDISGPVFKTYAGRTRRNSGLPTALCRPCSEVKPVVHDYAATP